MARIVNEIDTGFGGINQNGTVSDGSVFGKNTLLNTDNETTYFEAHSESSIELPSSSFVTDCRIK